MLVTDPYGGAHPTGMHRDPASPGIMLDEPGADTETWYGRQCAPEYHLETAWFPSAAPPVVTVEDLIPGVYDQMRRSIPTPVLDIAPPPVPGGYVNLGMFLAIEPPAPVTARADAGGVWAQATATLTSTTWDMGNGDIVECAGPGVAYQGQDVPREVEGPCGYTYPWPSAPQFTGTDDLAYHAAVTAVWSVQMTASDGRNDALDPIDMVFEYQYQVREIQAVGTAD